MTSRLGSEDKARLPWGQPTADRAQDGRSGGALSWASRLDCYLDQPMKACDVRSQRKRAAPNYVSTRHVGDLGGDVDRRLYARTLVIGSRRPGAGRTALDMLQNEAAITAAPPVVLVGANPLQGALRICHFAV